MTIAPPTGTKRFLSVEQTIASTLPTAQARLINLHVLAHCNPYALFMTCETPSRSHNRAMSSTESGTRGAKQDVVDTTAKILPLCFDMAFSSASKSVTTSSLPSHILVGTTSHTKPAERMALKHDFWSIRLQRTTFFFGRSSADKASRSAAKTKPILIPVQRGSRTPCLAELRASSPAPRRAASSTRWRASRDIVDEPTALG
mmetsp:Transcript_20188/g.57904  ORF Transcript_20188/g.57904 Transcript_20188/m.57904 type:complete len:202 (-) Transcript_20188:481-1086(-)